MPSIKGERHRVIGKRGNAVADEVLTGGASVLKVSGRCRMTHHSAARTGGHAAGAREFTRILEEDPELAQRLAPEDRRVATELFRAPLIFVTSSRWEPPPCDAAKTFGLLQLDGLLGRRVHVGKGVATELLGSGDILRPWEEPPGWNLIPAELDWRVLLPARLAVLDERITAMIGRRPELLIEFLDRLERRVRAASYVAAMSHLTRVEDRLLASLRHLASTWGRVTSTGAKIPFRLTHEVLGEIIGARRPSVTTALRQLHQRGMVSRGCDGFYVLLGDPGSWAR